MIICGGMNQSGTNEFSFLLKPSKYGVGVFAAHDIVKGTYLKLFGDESVRTMQRSEVPEIFQDYCVGKGEMLTCPTDFSAMHVGWYLNHSKDGFNAKHQNFKWFASRDIKAGEEMLVDYNTLEENEEDKQDYYRES